MCGKQYLVYQMEVQSQTEINAPRESRTRSHVHSTLTQSELNNMNEKERQFCEKTGIVFLWQNGKKWLTFESQSDTISRLSLM